LDGGSAYRKASTTQNSNSQKKYGHTSIPPERIETTIPVFERLNNIKHRILRSQWGRLICVVTLRLCVRIIEQSTYEFLLRGLSSTPGVKRRRKPARSINKMRRGCNMGAKLGLSA